MRLPFCVLIHSLLLRTAAQGYNGCSRACVIMADALCHSLRTRLGHQGCLVQSQRMERLLRGNGSIGSISNVRRACLGLHVYQQIIQKTD